MEFIWFALIGLCAGLLAGQLTKGGGFGLIRDLVVGVIGALLDGYLFRLLGIAAPGGLLGQLVVATVGAVVLLVILRLIRSGGRVESVEKRRAAGQRASILLVAFAASCGSWAPAIRELPLPKPNPTEAVFDLSFQRTHDETLGLLSLDRQTDAPIFGPIPRPTSPTAQPTTKAEKKAAEREIALRPSLTVETSHGFALGGAVFADPENVHDLYLHGFREPFWRSPVYRGEDGGLPFIAAFHVHFKEEGPNRTRVSITALDTAVVNGWRTGFEHGRFGPMWRIVRVKPTTIEEYMILRYLAHGLRQPELPPVELPARDPAEIPAAPK